jgi:endonuclease/exonuclease/phosphatase family metal-dependent hydrolase
MKRRESNLIEGEERARACLVLIKLKILSWNVRGINELDKRLRIKGLIREWKVDLVCLMETKMEVFTSGSKFMGLPSCGLVLYGG